MTRTESAELNVMTDELYYGAERLCSLLSVYESIFVCDGNAHDIEVAIASHPERTMVFLFREIISAAAALSVLADKLDTNILERGREDA